MDLSGARALASTAAETAPTLLEALMWGWLAGLVEFDVYADELCITDLRGPGYLTDDFQGEA